jgi:hypothetical protein
MQVVAKLEGMRLGKAAELVRASVAETLAYMTFPREHWVRIRTNNPLERLTASRTFSGGTGIACTRDAPPPLTVRIVGLDREVRLHLGVAPVAARA